MKFFRGLTSLIGIAILASCVEHEVIPAPKPEVELNASFSGMLEGAEYELIQDVDGYYCEPTQAKEILPTPQPSTVTYYSSMKSDSEMDFIQIGLGKLSFNADASIDPSLEQFTAFFNANTTPDFSLDAEEGVEIVFRDGQGNVWKSMEGTGEPQNFEFTSLVQESDEEGDYMKFVAQFDVSLFDDIQSPTDTIVFENAIFEGYFER